MKIVFMMIIFLTSLFATQNASKNDIKMLMEIIKLNQKTTNKRFEDMQKYMEKRFEQVDKRFKQVDKQIENNRFYMEKQFEQVDKRFEENQKYMEKRFEQVDKQIENNRFYMEKQFKQVDKRFEENQKHMEKRFEQVDKRFEDMNSNLRLMMMVFGSLFGLMFLYLIKDRYTIKKDVQVELAKEFETQIKQKADKELLDKVVTIIEEMAKKDNFVKEILNKHNLIFKT